MEEESDMLAVLQADLLKVKRKWFWLLVFLGPFGVISLQIVNYGVRYDYLLKQQPDIWAGVIENVNMFVCPALLLGITILASQIATIEHHQSSWKQLLSLPVSRLTVFSSKFITLLIMLFVSSTLLFIGTVLLGVGLKFGWTFPAVAILKNSFFPLLAALPVLAIQTWLSITFKNQAVSLTIGILGTMVGMTAYNAPDWFIWGWPLLSEKHEPIWFVTFGIIVGMAIVICGMIDFNKRDVK